MAKPTLKIQTPEWAVPLLQPARYKGAHGGRGSGKSHTFAEMLIEAHIMDQTSRSICVREVQKSLAQSVKRLLELKIEQMNAGAYFEVQEAVIKSKKGDGLIIFQGMQNHTADSIKSLEGYDRAWVEEAQSLSQRSLDLLRPTIRKPGSELWFTWNPALETDPVDALLRGEKPPPDAVVLEVNFDDNPWFPDVLRAEMEYMKKVDFEAYEHIWLGKTKGRSKAQVFGGKFRIDTFGVPPEAECFYGADWGFAQDPTTLIRCFVQDRKLFISHEAYGVGVELDETPALFDSVPGSRQALIKADNSRPETISHVSARGFSVTAAAKWAGSVEDGIAFLRSFEEIVIHERCKHTAEEFRLYAYKTDRLTGEVLPIVLDKHNHCIDALRYSLDGLVQTGTTGLLQFFEEEHKKLKIAEGMGDEQLSQPTREDFANMVSIYG